VVGALSLRRPAPSLRAARRGRGPGAVDGRGGRWAAARARSDHAVRFVIVGAGMAGILSAVELAEAGFDDVTVYEKADRLGGTWRENTYPGVACDVPSHLYSYSFAPNSEWSHTFSPGPEIYAYLEDVARRFGVDGRIRYGVEVTRLEFRPEGRWTIETSGGGRDEADVVIAATGVLHHPRHPDIDGLDDFGGAVFHSARWDHSVGLDGVRLGVVGTGSSAVQIVGAVVDRVAELSLFQRTAQWILPVPNNPLTDDDRTRFRSDPSVMRTMREQLYTTFTEGFAYAVVNKGSPQMKALEE